MTKTAITYIRVRGDGPTLDWQREVCRRAADRLGITITAEYIDQGWGQDRPARERMLRDLQRGDVLLIASYDRLARNLQGWRQIRACLEEAGVQLVVADIGVTDDDTLASVQVRHEIRDAICQFVNALEARDKAQQARQPNGHRQSPAKEGVVANNSD